MRHEDVYFSVFKINFTEVWFAHSKIHTLCVLQWTFTNEFGHITTTIIKIQNVSIPSNHLALFQLILPWHPPRLLAVTVLFCHERLVFFRISYKWNHNLLLILWFPLLRIMLYEIHIFACEEVIPVCRKLLFIIWIITYHCMDMPPDDEDYGCFQFLIIKNKAIKRQKPEPISGKLTMWKHLLKHELMLTRYFLI